MGMIDIVNAMDNSLFLAMRAVKFNLDDLKVGDWVIVYNKDGYSRKLNFQLDTIKSITKTGRVYLTKSGIYYVNGRSAGTSWHSADIVKHCNVFEDAYRYGSRLLKAVDTINSKISLLPADEILALADKLMAL